MAPFFCQDAFSKDVLPHPLKQGGYWRQGLLQPLLLGDLLYLPKRAIFLMVETTDHGERQARSRHGKEARFSASGKG